jgi:hypothetical protein
MAETNAPLQLGPPQTLRMAHPIAGSSMYIVGQNQPLPMHYWMVRRIKVTMQANAAVAGVPPLFVLYHAPTGVWESAAGVLSGTSIIGSGPQGDQMVLIDATPWVLTGTTQNACPYIISDINSPDIVPENRVLVAFINGYTTVGAVGYVQIEIVYTDWIIDVPKSSPLPVEVVGSAEDS